MFKKIKKVVAFALALTMLMGMGTSAFAAEKETETDSNIEISDITIKTEDAGAQDGVVLYGPAAPVTGLAVSAIKIGTDGYVYVTVAVTGYGKNNYCTWDNMQATLSSTGTDGRPIVQVNYLTYKCGLATIGDHKFYFRTTSCNSPWNTESISGTITISPAE